MKRTGHIYEKVIDLDNIKAAIVFASKDKRDRATVKACLADLDGTARRVQELLIGGFEPSEPRVRTIHDQTHGKDRLIACPRFFPDQIVHHALMQQLIPAIEPRMYAHSYGSIKGRGSHRAVHRVERWMRSGKRMRYALVMDVRKFYEHCTPEAVEAALRKRIKDERAIGLCMAIVNGYSPGLPLGYYTSQWLANLVLTDIDFKIKDAGAEHYARYMDDMVVLSKSKKRLHAIRRMVSAELAALGIGAEGQLAGVQAREPRRGLPGLPHQPRAHRSQAQDVPAAPAHRFSRAARREPTAHEAMALMSYYGVLSHADLQGFTRGLRPRKGELRKVIRNEGIQRQAA